MNGWAQGHTAEWEVYEEDMRRWNAGERRDKPRVPFQRGRHIDTLPIEQNGAADNLPTAAADFAAECRVGANFATSDVDFADSDFAAGRRAAADCNIIELYREATKAAAAHEDR